jgi:ribosomal protein S18 acetylase RimI-like enzyme
MDTGGRQVSARPLGSRKRGFAKLAVTFRYASDGDIRLLAELNRQLIDDERSSNAMSVSELEARMRGWLATHYRAVLFEVGSKLVAYALFRSSEEGVYLRQFFVVRSHRRQGLGRQAIELFRASVVPKGASLTVDVLVHNTGGIGFWRALGFRDHAISLRLSN